MKLHGDVKEKSLDIWQFSNDGEVDPDRTAFIHCSVSEEDHRGSDPTKIAGKNLYLFMELVSTVRVDEEDYQSIAAQMKASKSQFSEARRKEKEEMKRMEKERMDALNKKKKHIDGHIRFSADKSKLRRPKKRGELLGNKEKEGSDDEEDNTAAVAEEEAQKKAAEEATIKEENEEWSPDEDFMTVEMSAGWVMIPIADTLASIDPRKGTTKITLDMCGGTPFSVVGIQDGDVPRRAGFIAMVKRFFGIKVHSKLEFLISTKVNVDRAFLLPLPRNIIIPDRCVSLVGVYRHFLAYTLREYELHSQIDRILPQSGKLPTGDPLLSSFPRILNDPAAARVLMLLWRMQAPQSVSLIHNYELPVQYASVAVANPGNSTDAVLKKTQALKSTPAPANMGTAAVSLTNYTIPARTLEIFREVVLKLWRAMASPDTRPPRVVTAEAVKSIYRRELKLRKLVGIEATPAVLVNSAHIDAIKENEMNNKLRESNKAAPLADPDANGTMRMSSTPFNVRELLWGSEAFL